MKNILLIALMTLAGCTGKPDNIKPVENFQADRYLGTWYEIARIDHRFEKGLSQVTAQYSLRDDGGIKVVNRGYSAKDGKWKESVGKAQSLIEPLLTLFMGALLGWIMLSVIGPIYDVISKIKT